MSSLRELQRDFAEAVFDATDAAPRFATAPAASGAERIAIYRRAVFRNYRNALAATYPVVQRLVGAAFFNTAVDGFVHAQPSASGDLNIYGDAFADFLHAYPYASHLAYLPDVARLEWAIDEANRTPDVPAAPEKVLAALASVPPDRLDEVRLRLNPSCRLIASNFPILRIWQVNQQDYDGDGDVSFDQGRDTLLVQRGALGVSMERVIPDEYAWLAGLASGLALGAALELAQNANPEFDFSTALRTRLIACTITEVAVN